MAMDKRELIPQVMTVKDQTSDAIKIAKIITLGVFFTTMVTVSVFFAVRYGTVGSAPVLQCPNQQADHHQLMDNDVRRERDLKMKDGQILHERFTYDHKSNSVMVQTPGNISGESPATLVINYDKALVFAHVQDENICLVYSLRDEFGQQISMELTSTDRNVIDVASAVLSSASYVVGGEIPHGFVESSSGPMVDGMCAGRTTYWLDRVDKDNSNVREKRMYCFWIEVCAWIACYKQHICL